MLMWEHIAYEVVPSRYVMFYVLVILDSYVSCLFMNDSCLDYFLLLHIIYLVIPTHLIRMLYFILVYLA